MKRSLEMRRKQTAFLLSWSVGAGPLRWCHRALRQRWTAACAFGLSVLVCLFQLTPLSVYAEELASDFASITPSISATPELLAPPEVDLPTLSEPDSDIPLPARETSEPVAAETTSSESAITSSPRRFQYAFQLTVRGIYDDNITLNAVDPISDFYFSIDPVIVLAFGDAAERRENFVRFDYRPRLFFFTEHSNNDAFEHVARLEGQYSLRRLKIHASQEIQLLDGSEVDIRGITGDISNRVNLDVAGRTELDLDTTQLNATYDWSDKTFLTGGASYVRSDYPDLISSEVLAAHLGINIHYSPKLDLGLRGSVAAEKVEAPNPDQTFQQINAQFAYNPSGKLTVVGSGGLEFRQFDVPGDNTRTSPVFAVGATFRPFDGTTVTLNASRSTYSSAVLVAQDYTNTGVRLTVRQRLLRRLTLGLNTGFENAEYFSAFEGVEATRDDNYFFVQPGIDVKITRWWTVGAFYLYRNNNSTSNEFGFRVNQYGVQGTLTF